MSFIASKNKKVKQYGRKEAKEKLGVDAFIRLLLQTQRATVPFEGKLSYVLNSRETVNILNSFIQCVNSIVGRDGSNDKTVEPKLPGKEGRIDERQRGRIRTDPQDPCVPPPERSFQ